MRLEVELSVEQHRLLLGALSGARWRALVHADGGRVERLDELSGLLRAGWDEAAEREGAAL